MKTVLIVDDDKNLQRLYKAELESEGYRVLQAGNGREAIEMVCFDPPDIVILDIRMPEMDGMESIAHILRDHEKIPIIFNTAYSSYQDNFLAWAADGFVIKSSDLDPLKNKIREVLGDPTPLAANA